MEVTALGSIGGATGDGWLNGSVADCSGAAHELASTRNATVSKRRDAGDAAALPSLDRPNMFASFPTSVGAPTPVVRDWSREELSTEQRAGRKPSLGDRDQDHSSRTNSTELGGRASMAVFETAR